MIFINIVITCIALTMLATALSTALPAIASDLSIDMTTGQWLTSGYSLAMGIVMPLTAFLITRFPTKKLYVSGLLLALVGLVLCATATNFPMMMFARVLQATGNGILTSMAQVILLTIYPPEKRGSIMGWYGLSLSAAPVVAPTIAGIIVDLSNWRMIFYVVMVIVVISLIWALKVFDNVLDVSVKKFDVVSFVLSAIGFSGLTLGIGNIGTYSFMSFNSGGMLCIGLVALIIFALRQFKLSQPFLDLRVFKNKEYTMSVVGSMLLYLVMMGSTMILPLYIQTILGKSATLSGLVALPGSLVMAFISPIAGKMYDKLGMKLLTIVGALFLTFSNLGMFFINEQTSVIVAGLLNALRCAAIGCLMMPFVTWGSSKVPQHLMAHGTALLTSLRTIAGAIGTAIFVSLMHNIASHSQVGSTLANEMHGLNMTFLIMSGISVLLLVIGLSIKKESR
ncbi:multidrug efflux MFS transporter [Vagococcus zengguangii]|uniref:Multidrug efflux MFS transporter n=2 Tax=Vagococcus zengguangii TaxID=2571750 RepID=A0A4D7CSM1_9ENTE|nr:multidrug efflux MFS transporter [Vagococcus zengguangii]TLG80792.1 multidrug efflux MFS transporter [Vagococcus zengguangii]